MMTLGTLVKDCPKVIGFIGGTADKPAPISDKEADAILKSSTSKC
jgi:transcriptional antiterminator NusG